MNARGWRIFAVIVAVLLVIVGGPIAAYDVGQYTRCEAANDFRRDQRALWFFLLNLQPAGPDATQHDKDVRTKFVTYIERADAPLYCSLI